MSDLLGDPVVAVAETSTESPAPGVEEDEGMTADMEVDPAKEEGKHPRCVSDTAQHEW